VLILDAILHKAPTSPVRLNPDCPAELERIISKALEKDRGMRYQSASDIRADLKRLKRDTESGRVGAGLVPAQGRPQEPALSAAKGAPVRTWAAIALAGVALIAAIAGAVWFHFLRPPSKVAGPPMRIVPFTTFPGHQGGARFSPDGNQIAFSWDGEKEDNSDIYVKQVGGEGLLRLTTGPRANYKPVWSTDGRYIAFLRNVDGEVGVYEIAALGGPERKLLTPSLGALWFFESFDWSPEGKYLAYVDRLSDRAPPTLFLLAVENPQDQRRLTTSASQRADEDPRFSPDGKTVAFVRDLSTVDGDIFLARLGGGEPTRLTFDNVVIGGLDWTPDGAYIIFSSNRLSGEGRLWKVPASGGQPEPLPVGQGGAFDPALSRSGRLAYTQTETDANIWRYEVHRTNGRSAPPTKLIASTGQNFDPQYSPDGKRIVFVSSRSGSREVWVCDSDGSNPRQLTYFDGPHVGVPRWSPDGREIIFTSTRQDHDAIHVVSVEGGQPRRLMTDTWNEVPGAWSRDGKWIYFASQRTGSWQVWKMPAEGGQAVQVTKQGGVQAFESPDGKTLYYEKGWDEAATSLWKVPVEGGAETPVLKLPPWGDWGNWAPTAAGVYYCNFSTKAIELFSFATQRTTQIAKAEKPPEGGLAASPDGHWILSGQWDQANSHIMLVENFRW
jgi:Tol biopolymer transport system component